MEQDQERKIVLRILGGERDSYALLVNAYQGAIFNLAYRMTGSRQDADDLAQETFIRAFRSLRHFDPEKRFFTWLYTIGLNLIRNHLKKRGRAMARETAERRDSKLEIRDESGTEQELIRSQELHRLEEALQKLPVDLREAVVLRFYQDLSFEEIAAITNASLSAAKMRVYRGVERVKESMKKDE
jgi:RNA polymerase sigma-70 factor (ECF subfamily)